MEFRRIMSAKSLKEYDALVDSSAEGTLFHKTSWLKSIAKSYAHSVVIHFYGAYEDDVLVAAMPVFVHKKGPLRIIGPPGLTPYQGPFFLEKEGLKNYRRISSHKTINAAFAKMVSEDGLCYQYNFNHLTDDVQPFKWRGFDVGVHYTYVLDLRPDIDALWSSLDSSRRRDIKKAKKKVHEIKAGDLKSFKSLNAISLQNQDYGLNLEKLWSSIYRKNKKSCKIFTYYEDKSPKASLFLVWDGSRAYYLGGGVDGQSYGAMSFLMWEAIKFSKTELGVAEFDFEGSDLMSLEQYFRKFGGNLRPIFHIRKRNLQTLLLKGAMGVIRKLVK